MFTVVARSINRDGKPVRMHELPVFCIFNLRPSKVGRNGIPIGPLVGQ